jgi:hypothetical protein
MNVTLSADGGLKARAFARIASLGALELRHGSAAVRTLRTCGNGLAPTRKQWREIATRLPLEKRAAIRFQKNAVGSTRPGPFWRRSGF